MASDWRLELAQEKADVSVFPSDQGRIGADKMMKYIKETQELFRLEGRGMRETTGGLLDKETFKRCLARTTLGKHASNQALDIMFEIFDQDHSGEVNFDQFLMGLAIISEGSIEEKAELVFRSMDADENDFITREELEQRLTELYSMNTNQKTKVVLSGSAPKQEDMSNLFGMYKFVSSPASHTACLKALSGGRITSAVHKIFEEADKDKDGQISLQEWLAVARTNEDIRSILDLSFH